MEAALARSGFARLSPAEILDRLPQLRQDFTCNRRSIEPAASVRWIMGRLRPIALGNMPLSDLCTAVEKEVTRG